MVLTCQGQFAAGAGEPGRRPHLGLRVALAQLPIEDGNLEQNMRLAAEAAQEAARQHVDFLNLAHPQRVADLGASLLVAPHGFAAEPAKLEENAREYQAHIRNVAAKTKLWVIGTDAVLGTVQGGAWKGRLHSGCSLVARPDGTSAMVAKFKQPDLIIFDIPGEKD